MRNNKVVSARNAVEFIQPHDTVFTSGFVGTGTPEALIKALEQRYLSTDAPPRADAPRSPTRHPCHAGQGLGRPASGPCQAQSEP
jgi:acyl CoA:acetate/3-ketoacid CoA transferase